MSSAPPATGDYAVVQVLTQGTARAGSTNALALDAAASSEDDAYKGMTLELLLPRRRRRRGEIKQQLLALAQGIDHTAQAVVSYDAMQQGNAMQGPGRPAGHQRRAPDRADPAATRATSLDDYLADLLTRWSTDRFPPACRPSSPAWRAAWWPSTRWPSTPPKSSPWPPFRRPSASVTRPSVAGGPADLHALQELVRQFDNKSAGLIDYLRRPPDTTLPGRPRWRCPRSATGRRRSPRWNGASGRRSRPRWAGHGARPDPPGRLLRHRRPPGWRSRRCCASTAWATCRPPTPGRDPGQLAHLHRHRQRHPGRRQCQVRRR